VDLPIPRHRPVRQVIDVLVSEKRDLAATHRFFTRVLEHRVPPTEVSTDRAATYPRVLDELLPAACHVMEQYANNPIEADHGLLKSRLRPMRGLKRFRSAQVISTGHAFAQNLRRGHYELGVDFDPRHQALLRRRVTRSGRLGRCVVIPPECQYRGPAGAVALC
jgi:transposase, IS6 family